MNTIDNERKYGDWRRGAILKFMRVIGGNTGLDTNMHVVFDHLEKYSGCSGCHDRGIGNCLTGGLAVMTQFGLAKCGGKKNDWYWEEVKG